MLVCPGLDCEYVEQVQIADRPDDAVIFSSSSAAWRWSLLESAHQLTLGEIEERLWHLRRLYAQTASPKLPSQYRYWRERGRFQYWNNWHDLNRHMKENDEADLEGKDFRFKGRVLEFLDDRTVLIARSDNGETVVVRIDDLHNVYGVWNWPRSLRFNFGDGSDALKEGNHVIHTSTRFAVVMGHRVGLDSVTRHGICRVRTSDPETARSLNLRLSFPNTFSGELPVALVERAFKAVTHCYVGGYRLNFLSITNDPEIVQVGTRNMEAAQALKMRRDGIHWIGQRQQLRWWRFINLSMIERFEEKQIPINIWELVRAAEHR